MEKTLEIKSIASTGNGAGYIEEGGFKVPYFVPFTCPGDVVKVREIEKRKKYVEAELVELVKASPHRSDVKCKHYTICGGCNLLHIKYETQLGCKKEVLAHVLARSGISFPEIEVMSLDNPFNYRFRAKAFFECRDGKLICGFNQRKTNYAVRIDECHIVHKKILEAIKAINKAKLTIQNRFIGFFVVNEEDLSVTLQLTISRKFPGFEEAFKGTVDEFVYRGEKQEYSLRYSYEIDKKEYSLSYSSSFIQSNLALNKRMVEALFDCLKGIKQKKALADLYCGNGNLSLPLTAVFGKVVMVEGEPYSFANLQKNIQLNAVSNAEACNSDVREFSMKKLSFDAVILDPPRIGCGEDVINNIARWSPETIIYVSCNPVVASKELKLLMGDRYRIDKTVMIDMFPHTNHIEFIAFLRRR
jgi:23S rRNA (uracil1939-C5)-methyltransferase